MAVFSNILASNSNSNMFMTLKQAKFHDALAVWQYILNNATTNHMFEPF